MLGTHLSDRLHGADVRVRAEKDVLQLGLLLVHSLHGQLGGRFGLLGILHLASITSTIRSLLLGRFVFGFVTHVTRKLCRSRDLRDNQVFCAAESRLYSEHMFNRGGLLHTYLYSESDPNPSNQKNIYLSLIPGRIQSTIPTNVS